MGVPLSTTAQTFPVWSSDPVLLPAGQAIEYKYVVQAEDRTGKPRWEEGGLTGNRSATPVTNMQVISTGTWGRADTQSKTIDLAGLDIAVPQFKRQLSQEESSLARQSEEKKLVMMAESTQEAAAAEVNEAQPMAVTLAAREPMKRNFSQSLIDALAEASPTASESGTEPKQIIIEDKAPEPSEKAEAAPKRGMPLRHVNSLTALSLMADSQEKHDARALDCRSKPLYQPHNVDVPIVVVTSELSPWSKTGGLGLVAASYSYEFPRTGHRTMVVSPKYKDYSDLTYVGETRVSVNGREEVVKYMHHWMEVEDGRGCDCVFVEHPAISKNGGLYNDDNGREYEDNLFRFTLLSMAAMEAPLILRLGGSTYGDKCLFLANDWQAGLVPLYMTYKYKPHGVYAQARVIYVVHNLGYQGQYHGCNACHFFGVGPQAAGDLKHGNCINLSKGALICADRVITVSPNYANEIQTPEGGFSLQDFVRAKAHSLRLVGILNGIDDVWNPATDKNIAVNYTTDDFAEAKAANKAALQRLVGLIEDPHCVVIGFVGRLTWQKGVDVIGQAIPWLMGDAGNGVTGNAQLIMMGNGQREYAETLRWAEGNFKGRVVGYVGFDPKIEHQIMAGCDLFLMPSRYEPCGLPQMYSQRYGTLPIVTATGGLKDTVKDISEGPSVATGFQVPFLSPDKLKEVIYRAAELFLKRPAEFRCMQRTAMSADFGWPRAMDEYERSIDFTLYDPPVTR
uniref:starch synthase n=1 Tax=Alexandrium catenella TaxID=2925 RepID=A0A7S1LTS3_ALECA